ncbi:Hypothetical protein POVR2_LOCUS195 [uncultured virus]|nr:Hypothetical protein POVR2_LOCUS195 [uncultured virus]
MACSYNDVEQAKSLLATGAVPTYFCLSIPVEQGYTDIVQLILQDGRVDPTVTLGSDLEHIVTAAAHGYADIVELLLDDTRVTARVLEHNTKFGLRGAILGSHLQVVELVVNKLKQLDLLELYNEIGVACCSSGLEVINYLFEHYKSECIENTDCLLRGASARKRPEVEQLIRLRCA